MKSLHDAGLWLARQNGFSDCHECKIAHDEKAQWLLAEKEYIALIRRLEAAVNAQ